MPFIIDTNAWVEYFLGTKSGEMLRKMFEDTGLEFVTVECTVSELKSWTMRENKNFDETMSIVKSNSHILRVELIDWILAAQIKQEMRKKHSDFGLIDALLLSIGSRIKAKVVSGDPHFENIKEAIFFKE